ncbi:MAG: hypothetical protein UY21_C0001G0051 [Microgenomates group bacterium GW2011_GWA1_48_10]|nr:MAG: hypothetical protein UY21_C0001G0051 [Microgenomates group bacterium GW2011_GWA1_48_10]
MTRKIWIILLSIVLLGAFLRFYLLGKIPASLDWDEASIGDNAYSLLKTSSDEYGNRFPLSIRSFNDYKPPLYVYATIPSIALFGKNEFAIRFPSAFVGTLSILATFLLIQQLLNFRREKNSLHYCIIALLISFLLAVSPWHIQFSRLAFEANLALFFSLCGWLFLTKFISQGRWWPIIPSTLSYVLALYSYHSARLVVPLFLLGIGFYYHRILFARIKTVLVGLGLAIVLLLPLALSTLQTTSLQARWGEVSIFSSAGLRDTVKVTLDAQQEYWRQDKLQGDRLARLIHTKFISYSRLLAKNYLDHFNFSFLFLEADGNGRHHAPGMGLLYLVEAPFLLYGGYLLLRRRPTYSFFLVWAFLVAPSAASLTADTPHAVRSLSFLPSFQIITAFGLYSLLSKVKTLFRGPLLLLISLLFLANFYYFFHQYFVHFGIEHASSFQYGYKEMVAKVRALSGEFDQIYVTVKYDQPYIYFLFYGHSDPRIKNDGTFQLSFDKYRFVNWGELTNEQKSNLSPKILAVHAPDDFFSPHVILDKIYYPDGKVVFVLSHM